MTKFILKITFILTVILFTGFRADAQKKVKLKQANKLLSGMKNEERYNRFIGDVIFEQNETTIYSDSAHFYSERNYVEAFGHVRITEGDSVTITSRKLIYEGDTKEAKLRDNVVFVKKGQVTLFTDYLDYFRLRQEAQYYNGGKLVDSTNVLTSKKGYYQVNTNMASFKSNVVAVNPDYTLKSDTLQYNTQTNIVYFRAPTEIIDSEGSLFNYKEGQYDTNVKRSDLNIGQIETPEYILSGDNLNLDDLRKYYTATGNVEMVSKEQDVIITGDKSFYQKKSGISKVFGRALMKKVMQNDTLYLTADTLVAIENEDPSKKRLLAYNNVKIFKKDLQGVSDSLAYFTADSIIYFYGKPALWANESQLTADSINMEIANGTINKLNMTVNSFVISKDSIENYNQVKGRSMVAYFDEGNIQKVDVNGNAESLFFALDESDSYLIGMNKILSSYMIIRFKLNKVDNLSPYVNAEGSFIPPHELEEPQKKLKDFKWREEERPLKETLLVPAIHPTKSGVYQEEIPSSKETEQNPKNKVLFKKTSESDSSKKTDDGN